VSLGRARAALTPSPRLRRRLLAALVLVLALAALYTLWLRDSSLVAVEEVHVTGLTSENAEHVRAALASTGQTMTTLHVDMERLEETAAVFPVVARIEVSSDFPHGLTIQVIEHRPAAILDVGGRTVPVAGDGSILAGLPVQGDLPTIELSGPMPERELPPGAARDAALVAGAAPPVISRRLEALGREGGARGVVAQVEGGPEILFGAPERAAAKWAAAARVLADQDSAGAAYIDVRIPERPAAGGLPVETLAPVAPAADAPLDPTTASPDSVPAAPLEAAPVAPEVTPETVSPALEAPAAPAPVDPGGGATVYPQP
jgi:cell division protein FtsQ